MSQYTSEEKIEKIIGRELTQDEKDNVTELIESVSSVIDNYTNRHFFDYGEDADDQTDQTKTYDGNGQRELFIDDYTSITTLKINGYTETEFYEYPLNTTWKNSIYLPYARFSSNRASIEVTGIFGWVLPSELMIVASELAGAYLSEASNTGDYKSESIEGYSYVLLTGAEKMDKYAGVLSKIDRWRKIIL